MNHSHVMFGDHSLRAIASESGPFVTMYLRPGPDLPDRLESLTAGTSLDAARVTSAIEETERRRDHHANDGAPAAHCCIASVEGLHVVPMSDPVRIDVVRRGSVPSLGALLESIQLVPSHAVVIIDVDSVRLVTFGTSLDAGHDSPTSDAVASVEHLTEQLRFLRPAKIAVVGPQSSVESILPVIVETLPSRWVDAHFTDDSDVIDDSDGSPTVTDTVADEILRSAASLGAENITHELGRFRVASTMGFTAEGDEALHALRAGAAASVLVHDDVDDDRTLDGDRLADVVVAEAIRRAVPLTMIPKVAPGRGPAGGIGAVLSGEVGINASSALESDHTDGGVSLDAPAPATSQVRRTIA